MTPAQVGATAKELLETLKPLADKIGQSAEALYRMAIKQEVIEAWTTVICAGIAALVCCAMVWLLIKAIKVRNNSDVMDNFGHWLAVIFFIVIGTFAIDTVACQIPRLLNPEFTAIESLIRMVK